MAAYNAVVYAAATYGTGSAPKRMRLSEEPPKPSRVLHLRGLPPDTTEAEITQLTTLFGIATNIILTRQKNQALVEMLDLSTAQQMVDYYKHMPARIRSQPIHVQFSMHERLKSASQPAVGSVPDSGTSNTILRVIVDNMLYPITLETLHMLFSKYGQVQRIITFNKNNSFQALIEFADALSAQAAKMTLNGQNVYNGCCALHIDFSKLKRLSVRYNNDKSRDFTNPQLGSDDHLGNLSDPGHPRPPPPPAPGQMPGPGVWGPYPGPGFNMDTPGNSVFGFYPGPPGGGGSGNMPMPHPQFGYPGVPMGGAAGQMPFMNPGMAGGPPFMPPGPPLNPPSGAAAHHVQPGSGSVVLVSNLDPEESTVTWRE